MEPLDWDNRHGFNTFTTTFWPKSQHRMPCPQHALESFEDSEKNLGSGPKRNGPVSKTPANRQLAGRGHSDAETVYQTTMATLGCGSTCSRIDMANHPYNSGLSGENPKRIFAIAMERLMEPRPRCYRQVVRNSFITPPKGAGEQFVRAFLQGVTAAYGSPRIEA